ncbi:MAG: hypothetical protein AAGH76_14095 [Pseudomonadota bacterium]
MSNWAAAREWTHLACQPLSRAARANLPAVTDDSHSALLWNDRLELLCTAPLSRTVTLAIGFKPLRYVVVINDEPGAEFELVGTTGTDALAWLNDILRRRALRPADVADMPYTLPDTRDWSSAVVLQPDVSRLGLAISTAHAALTTLVRSLPALHPGPSPVRLWPHHFDIATLVQLKAGDPESAPSIGSGYSPGDGNYAEPYLYCSPYPQPTAHDLPEAPDGWHWHTAGFVSLVYTDPPIDAGAMGNAFRQAFQVAMTLIPPT